MKTDQNKQIKKKVHCSKHVKKTLILSLKFQLVCYLASKAIIHVF
jgi:hypothetical protein